MSRQCNTPMKLDNPDDCLLLLESVEFVPWEADPATWCFTYIGPQVEALLGYPRAAWAQPDFWVEHIHPDDREWAPLFCKQHTEVEESFVFEYRMTAADGRVVWLRDSVQVRTRADGTRVLSGVFLDITERKAQEQALARAVRAREERDAQKLQRNAQFAAIFNSITDAAVFADLERRMTLLNPAALALFGYSEEELLGQRTQMLYASAADYELQGQRRFNVDAPQTRTPVSEIHYRRKDGSLFWGETLGLPVMDPKGEVIGFLGLIRDVTARRAAEAQMARLTNALEQSAEAVCITDRQGRIEYVNQAYQTMTGYRREEVMGRSSAILKSGRQDADFYRGMWGKLSRGEVFEGVLVNRRKDGGLYHEEKTITPIRNAEGEVDYFVSTSKDITARMETEEQLHYLAHHDVLTNLPNRALFMDRLEHALTQRPHGHQLMALLFLDLDRFKVINDTLGHDVGDRLLQELAQRLRNCVREGDTVARLGGDEFGIILEGLNEGADAATVAHNIIDALTTPFEDQGNTLFVTISIGISLAPTDAKDAQGLLKNADIAMYRAKERGRNNYQFYASEMGANAAVRLGLETELRYALQRDQFVLHYQPKVDLQSQVVTGVEALLRWQHPEQGLLGPDRFIDILEETGLIVAVGEWVLRTACTEVAGISVDGQPLHVGVNLSGIQFTGGAIVQTIQTILEGSGLAAERLEIEITESLLLHDDRHTLQALTQISDMGVHIAIDDFGTGYSALSYLKRFPIDCLKIDRSFIRDITSDPDDAAIVEAIIAMSRSLGLQVVAEGVEGPEQLAFLRAQGCAVGQGYLFSRPGRLLEVLSGMQGTT